MHWIIQFHSNAYSSTCRESIPKNILIKLSCVGPRVLQDKVDWLLLLVEFFYHHN